MSHGVQAVPDTHATRRILSIMFFQTLPEVSKSLCARSLVMGTLEVIGGVRVGEACGGGDGHGALANDLCIMNPLGEAPGGASETCELWLADSKTAFARYVNFVGKSHGIGIAGAEYIRALWKESGWKIDSLVEDGMQVERPDYWVVRISLLDMTDAQVAKLARAIGGAKDGDVALQAKATLVKLQQRRNAHTLGEERKYVNVAGGPRDGPQLRTAEALMRANGLHTFMDKVPGPLLSSTHGRRLSHMPLAVDSSYTHLIGALRKAWVISEAMDDPDPELDLDGLEKPKWRHHTFRRSSDRFARETMEDTGVSKEDIDDQFGSDQAQRAKVQQLRYAGRAKRSQRAKISMMI